LSVLMCRTELEESTDQLLARDHPRQRGPNISGWSPVRQSEL